MDEIPISKSKESKPIRKGKIFWVIVIIAVIAIISIISRLGGNGNKISDGIDSNFYKTSVVAYNDIKLAYENGGLPGSGVTSWVAAQDRNRSPGENPSEYTAKENYILDRLRECIVDITMLKQSGDSNSYDGKIEDSLNKLAKALGEEIPTFNKESGNNTSNNNKGSVYSYNKSANQQAISGLYGQSEPKSINGNNGNSPPPDTGSTQPNSYSPSPHEYSGVNDVDENGVTQLARAAGNGDVQQVKDLLGKGADPNLQNGMGEPPLLWAVRGNYDDIVNVLLNAGANPNYKSSEGEPPLSIAKANGENAVVQDLLKYGAK